MLELGTHRKNKVNLADYPLQQDVNCRLLMADFSQVDIDLLEEILYSPLKISLKKLSRAIECDDAALLSSLKKFESIGLLSLGDDAVQVDKEKRKIFEFEITRFDPNFKPDMEFLQGLLRKVPIHVLPTWYSIPRTSNNIFESIVEKYLLTPHIFQRYLAELNFTDPLLNRIIQDVHTSPDLKVSSSDLIAKYNLTAKEFEEKILMLEFHFACCLVFEKEEDHWIEFVTPFHEWREYLCFFRATEPVYIDPKDPIENPSTSDFAFIEELESLLLKSRSKPFAIENTIEKNRAVEKLALLKLANLENGRLQILDAGESWLDLSLENRALFLYRHSNNQILNFPAPERLLREAEKAIKRVMHGEWVYFDDFLKGVIVPLSEHSVVMLKKLGKHWKYALPVYSDEEKKLIKATLFDWLYEFGIVTIGKCKGRDCFAVTRFGRFFFED